MNSIKLVLADNTEIALYGASGIGAVQIHSVDKASMIAIWDKLTPDNLKAVQIVDADNLNIGSYANLVLSDPAITSVAQLSDGSVITTYAMRQKTAIELLQEELGTIKENTEINTGAILDLGGVVGEIAGGKW